MNNSKDAYSVVMAVKENGPFLLSSIQSITAQSLRPAEILLILDQDSSDFEGLKSTLSLTFPKLVVLRSPGTGMIEALNFGIQETKTEYISFLDADDLWLSNKQMDQVTLLNSDPDIDVVTGLATNSAIDLIRETKDAQWIPAMMFTCSTFRKSLFTRVGLLDPESTHFTWLYRWWAHALQVGICRIALNEPATIRRIHDNNSWRQDNAHAQKELFRELRRIMTPISKK
jgi:glycosyltransferase involved in cell wall biosynthesis